MRLPVLRGIIERRILVNYRVAPKVLASLLPAPFRPQLVGGYGVAGLCLIRLKGIAPRGFPPRFGLTSENAAHRIAVEWDAAGARHAGVYVPRRDTSSRLNALAGGRLFPGVQYFSRFGIHESDDEYHVDFVHRDGTAAWITGRLAERLSADSLFASIAEASEFFACGSLGYSPTGMPGVHEGIGLCTRGFRIEPLRILELRSSMFDNRRVFPPGAIEPDSAFLMRETPHEWRASEPLRA